MGKRSDFKRIERDLYLTPYEGTLPLLPHLPASVRFAEPCAANGQLADWLELGGHNCSYMGDIEPLRKYVEKADMFTLDWYSMNDPEMIITNPPWSRDVLHRAIEHFITIAPTWLLFDADWMHTVQSAPYMPFCHKIVSVGRLKWIPDSKQTGKDNCCWYLFDKNRAQTQFIGRVGK